MVTSRPLSITPTARPDRPALTLRSVALASPGLCPLPRSGATPSRHPGSPPRGPPSACHPPSRTRACLALASFGIQGPGPAGSRHHAPSPDPGRSLPTAALRSPPLVSSTTTRIDRLLHPLLFQTLPALPAPALLCPSPYSRAPSSHSSRALRMDSSSSWPEACRSQGAALSSGEVCTDGTGKWS